MPKTLTGEELQLDDAPARDSELFLVDGNNLAYRAFFALPEELATSEGFSTNALLGFTNMLFKLLSDYRPKGVAVAWDTRPTHRHETAEAVDVVYKEGRREMPDLLREQFPYFRPIVEAFGYRNLEFEGWEADDVIATLATRADDAGVKTTVVSTDRDAFQLVSDNVALMMTPRGVSDVHVYTPERVEARLGIRPDQVPDFIGLKGDPSDNIPGIPGIGDKTAGQLIAQYGSLEEVIEHADELTPARSRAVKEHAEQARAAKALRVSAADDTMIAAYLIEPSRASYELDDLAAEYGVELLPQPEAEEETARLVRHAAATLRLREPLLERVRERGHEQLYREIELPLTPVLVAMEQVGVKIDTYRMGEITARLADRVEELEAKAHELAGEDFMLGSTQQVARILFEELELTPGRKGKTGYSTDTRVLRTIRGEHEIVPVIEEWREYSKLLNTYLGPLPSLLGEDGRLHTTFNQTVAATGRLSTSNPNLQAIPIRTDLGREIRSAFIADEGCRLVSADYSQVELRILAHVSGEPKLREAFARGEDIHAATAAEVLGKEQATLTKDKRNIAKMVNFGIIYGISSFGLSENLEISREEAQTYIDAYLARFPMVQDFIERTIEQATRDGYVTTLLGRRRPVPEIRASGGRTLAQARPCAASLTAVPSSGVRVVRATVDDAELCFGIARAAAVAGFRHVFPPDLYEFPADAIRADWLSALSDPDGET